MILVDDISPGGSLPAPMTVEVRDVDWNVGKSRRAEITLIDAAGKQLRLVDYEGANISTIWKRGQRYCISNCRINKGGGDGLLVLAPSKNTQIELLDSTEQTIQLLVIGDTHIGRTEHPKNGEEIDPLSTFITAVEYGIKQKVDAVIHVGDIFHESATKLQAELVKRYIFAPLNDVQIPFYYVRGNHSSKYGDKILEELDGTHLTHLDTTGISVGSQIRIFGIDHHEDGELSWNSLTFPTSVSEPMSILFLHQTIQQISPDSPTSVDLNRVEKHFRGQFDYFVSGHHHDAWQEDSKRWMYAGATERMSKNQDPDDRLVWLFRIESGSVVPERYDIP